MHFSTGKLRDMQKKVAKEIQLDDSLSKEDIKRIAAFDMAFVGDKIVCATIVLSYPDLKIIEQRYLVKTAPMNYIPTFLCFREGPLILESYYNLESEPDVLMIRGHGIAHPYKCGLAAYVGVELAKPTIGVASRLLEGVTEENGKLMQNGEEVGRAIKPTKHANFIYVNPGNMISIEMAEEIVTGLVQPPHKMPEPIHIAHKMANKSKKKLKDLKSAGEIEWVDMR